MQIGSGWCKGMKIETPEGLDTRPTRTRIRESVLNILQPWTNGARVADLFAGSGVVGLELISRGASKAVFVENAAIAMKSLKSNVESQRSRSNKQKIELGGLEVVKGDAMSCLTGFANESLEIIWADPPYRDALKFFEIAKSEIMRVLTPQGVFALESGSELEMELQGLSASLGWNLLKQRKYGVTLISIWEKPSNFNE